MQNCLGELNLTYALIYLDDVIVFSRTEGEHLHCLRVVFAHFLEHGLKLKPSKCHFLQDEITFLGHEISAEGIKPGTANLKAIVEMAPPKTYTEIRCFTGMTGFFRQFIKGYSKIAKPLNDLPEGEASKLKAEEVELPLDALKAFEELKLRCMTAPVLVFADFKKGCVPPSPDAGDHGIHGRHPVLFHYGLEIRFLAGQNGQEFPAIHRLHGG